MRTPRIEFNILIFMSIFMFTGCSVSAERKSATETAQADIIAQTAIANLLADFTRTSEAMVTITLRPDQVRQTTPSPSFTQTATSVATAASFSVAPVVPTEVPEMAEFVSETIADDTVIDPGDTFTKSWVLKNSGETTWTAAYMLVFVHGDQMGGPDWRPIGQQVLPGEVIEISVSLTAPLTPGTYAGYWKLSDPSGNIFGVEPQGSGAFYLQIVVPYADTKTPTATEVDETATDTVEPVTATMEPTEDTTSAGSGG